MRPLKGTLSPRAATGRIIGATTKGTMRERPWRRRRTRRAATALALAALLACAALRAGASLVTGATGGEEAAQASATEGDGAPDAAVEEVGAEEASVQALEYGYPDISANELAAVWGEI